MNCGLSVGIEGNRLVKIRGDRAHPSSRGYLCEKAQRLDHYQNGVDRVVAPLRRRADGSFEPIEWDVAIAEIVERLAALKAEHGGECIFYYGGGGQGNHLGGSYAAATRAALGAVFTSNALAQEKTGEFWVDGQLYGRPRCHTAPDFEHAEVALFVGKNPWQSHGLPRARAVLKEIAADPARALIVVDPCLTETAELADYHLRLRPGTDAFLLSALLGVLAQEDLIDHDFLAKRCEQVEPVLDMLRAVAVGEHASQSGVDEALVRTVARRIAAARSVSVLEDLGLQQSCHSTLNSYLEKLIYLLTGNFARAGGMNIHTRLASLGGGGQRSRTSPVGGHRIIAGLIPCNVIPDEILTDHPQRFRAMIVESANPAHSLADSPRMREALRALSLVVVIDVAMTETARCAHYVLPAPTQFEKWEATFFNLGFPDNVFHLRAPIFEPPPNTLCEPEIHRRIVRGLGALRDEDLAPLHAALEQGRSPFASALQALLAERPALQKLLPVILYETLGASLAATLGRGAESAALLWAAAHSCAAAYPDSVRRAGFDGDGMLLGEALFQAMLERRSGLTFTIDEYSDSWSRLATPSGLIRLAVPELLQELGALSARPDDSPRDFPFVLSAGERRSSTANTIFRDPAWRARDAAGALRMNADDAKHLGVASGSRVRVSTARGSAEAMVEVSARMQPGHISLPNGYGLTAAWPDGNEAQGVALNELTSSEHRDPIAGTPWHKHVPARVEAIPTGE
jgi:anaerobic selenocysteine-containing dehydrogenase